MKTSHRSALFLLALASPAFATSALASSIQKNPEGYYGAGIITGRMVKISKRGFVFKTQEVTLKVGGSNDSSRYIEQNKAYSVDRAEVAEKLESLDANKAYVFRFVYKHPFNPEIEDSHFQIRAIEELRARHELPAELEGEHEAKGEKKGGYSEGKRTGRISGVTRWGLGRTVCTLHLNAGGVDKAALSSPLLRVPASTDALGNLAAEVGMEIGVDLLKKAATAQSSMMLYPHLLAMNIYNEELCRKAEQLARHEVDVRIDYTEDYIEWWDSNKHVVEKITVLKSGSGG